MNVYVVALIIAAILGVLGVFFGYVKSVGKSFENNQPQSSINTTQSKQQQKDLADDAEAQRRAYMEDIKQKMRDSQRR
jgi:uncharacterized protein HemX